MTKSSTYIYCVEIYDEKGYNDRICTNTMPLGFEIKNWVKNFIERYGSSKVKVVIKKIPVEVVEE